MKFAPVVTADMIRRAKAAGRRHNALYCSFCGKAEHEVFALVSGPAVLICDECIAAAQQIVNDKKIAAGALAVIQRVAKN